MPACICSETKHGHGNPCGKPTAPASRKGKGCEEDAYGFEILGLEALVSFTVPANARSRRVMEKLGMTHNPADDFDHPRLPQDHPLCHHVLYRLHRSAWREHAE